MTKLSLCIQINLMINLLIMILNNHFLKNKLWIIQIWRCRRIIILCKIKSRIPIHLYWVINPGASLNLEETPVSIQKFRRKAQATPIPVLEADLRFLGQNSSNKKIVDQISNLQPNMIQINSPLKVLPGQLKASVGLSKARAGANGSWIRHIRLS